VLVLVAPVGRARVCWNGNGYGKPPDRHGPTHQHGSAKAKEQRLSFPEVPSARSRDGISGTGRRPISQVPGRDSLPGRALRLVREWLAEHREELNANWERARTHEAPEPIAPLR
jgi:Domain of unknown function (DUF4160)